MVKRLRNTKKNRNNTYKTKKNILKGGKPKKPPNTPKKPPELQQHIEKHKEFLVKYPKILLDSNNRPIEPKHNFENLNDLLTNLGKTKEEFVEEQTKLLQHYESILGILSRIDPESPYISHLSYPENGIVEYKRHKIKMVPITVAGKTLILFKYLL